MPSACGCRPHAFIQVLIRWKLSHLPLLIYIFCLLKFLLQEKSPPLTNCMCNCQKLSFPHAKLECSFPGFPRSNLKLGHVFQRFPHAIPFVVYAIVDSLLDQGRWIPRRLCLLALLRRGQARRLKASRIFTLPPCFVIIIILPLFIFWRCQKKVLWLSRFCSRRQVACFHLPLLSACSLPNAMIQVVHSGHRCLVPIFQRAETQFSMFIGAPRADCHVFHGCSVLIQGGLHRCHCLLHWCHSRSHPVQSMLQALLTVFLWLEVYLKSFS